MAELNFRNLKADEIECRVATCSEKGVSLLLYKDARCDMNILDETVGPMDWQRTHLRDNANCIVSIWDAEKQQWISKEDTGTESYTEAQKGLASDSFKRACFNWGIGRELYTAPFIWIPADQVNLTKRNDGKYTTYDTFKVKTIDIKDKKIVGLEIVNLKTRKVAFTMKKKASSAARDELRKFMKENGIDQTVVVNVCGLNNDSTEQDFIKALEFAKTLV